MADDDEDPMAFLNAQRAKLAALGAAAEQAAVTTNLAANLGERMSQLDEMHAQAMASSGPTELTSVEMERMGINATSPTKDPRDRSGAPPSAAPKLCTACFDCPCACPGSRPAAAVSWAPPARGAPSHARPSGGARGGGGGGGGGGGLMSRQVEREGRSGTSGASVRGSREGQPRNPPGVATGAAAELRSERVMSSGRGAERRREERRAAALATRGLRAPYVNRYVNP